MLQILRSLLIKIIDNIDAGNSNCDEAELVQIVSALKDITDKEKPLSKYSACKYLNVSRATFDNYVRENKLPKGKKVVGFKELMWTKKDLDKAINIIKNK